MASAEVYVTVEADDDGIAVLRIDRPKANALSKSVLVQLGAAAEQLVAVPPKAVVIYGGERIFAAGAEISEFRGAQEAVEMGNLFHYALNMVSRIPRVTIAAINGFALGGGCELALACDFRVAASNAKLGQPEILLGIIPGGGGTQRLARLVGPSKAKELIFSGRQVGGKEAFEIGLVDRLAEPGEALGEAKQWALSFAQGAVVAQGMAKRAIDVGLSGTLEHGLDLERFLFAEVFTTKDSQIGVKSFLESGPGKAKFEGE